MFLFGAISFLCVNLSNSLSVGIGIGIVVWMVLTSTMASNIPAFLLLENRKQDGRTKNDMTVRGIDYEKK